MEKSNHRILIVDDDLNSHKNIKEACGKENYNFESATNVTGMWDKLDNNGAFDLLLLDLKLDSTQKNIGLDLIAPIKEKYPQVPIIIATNENSSEVLVEAMNAGAKNFLIKSAYNKEKWTQKIQDAILAKKASEALSKLIELENKFSDFAKQEQDEKFTFIWRDANTSSLIKNKIEPIKSMPYYNLLITGEIGSGKEVLARYLHKEGNRSTKPFVYINLSNISSKKMRKVLFGDIHKRTLGCFKEAEGGILLLDGIDEISEGTQKLLLNFYQHGTILPVGHDEGEEIDVAVIASTRRSIEDLQTDGKFDPDLLNQMLKRPIHIPPLRERKGDIIPIIKHYLSVYLKVTDSQNMLSEEVQTILLSYDWPGNIRELRYTIDYMILKKRLLDKTQIDKDCLPYEVMNTNGATSFQADVNIETWATLFDGIDDQDIWCKALKIQVSYECKRSELLMEGRSKQSHSIYLNLWEDLSLWIKEVQDYKKGESPVSLLTHLKKLESQYPQASVLLNRLEGQFLKFVVDAAANLLAQAIETQKGNTGPKKVEFKQKANESLYFFPSEMPLVAPDITELSVTNTFIQSIPDTLGKFSKLEKLDLQRNTQLAYFPAQEILQGCPHLEHLNLRGTELETKLKEVHPGASAFARGIKEVEALLNSLIQLVPPAEKISTEHSLNIFIAHARQLKESKSMLVTHLAALIRGGLIHILSEDDILPGKDKEKAIEEMVQSARIVVPLIESRYWSDDKNATIIDNILDHQHKSNTQVIPVYLNHIDKGDATVGKLKPLPDGWEKPVMAFDNPDEAWYQVAAGIRRVVENIRNGDQSSPK